MKLSILICSIEKRRNQLAQLLSTIHLQNMKNVEAIFEVDNCEMTVGKKRNLLLKRAQGLFSVFVDDDDAISPSYVGSIMKILRVDTPDCIGIEGIITFSGRNPRKFVHSITCKGWYEENGIYYRTPNHLNPIKTELARKVGFPETNFGEDKAFSDRILPLLKTEVKIDKPIYFYRYDEKNSATNGR